MKTAIYLRQSLDKEGSLSIFGQKEMCLKFAKNRENIEIYSDKGWSGKNISRPAFEKMMEDVEANKIDKIIIYRFDRISRSLSDFVKIQEKLEKYNVHLFSCSENFDTSTEIGKFMLRILIMFAEMERKAIVQRISDNYKIRASEMKYLGGKVPFGYKICCNEGEKYIIEDKNESEIVRNIFDIYLNKAKNCEKTSRIVNEKYDLSKKFSGSSILKILKNVIYVESGKNVENYFKSTNLKLNCNEKNNYNGYIKVKNEIYPSQHRGFINENLWIETQKLIKYQGKNKNLGKGETSFLQGMILCEKCAGSVYVKSNGRGNFYLQCQGKRSLICDGYKALKTGIIENIFFEAVCNKIVEMNLIGRKNILNTFTNNLKLEKNAEEFKKTYNKRKKEFEKMHSKNIPDSREILADLKLKWKMIKTEDKREIVREFVDHASLNNEEITIFMK